MDARRDWTERTQAARTEAAARALGLDVFEYRAALSVACRVWHDRKPWRLMPGWLSGFAWEAFGARFAGRFVREWANG